MPVERIAGSGPVLLTCEHASNRLPPGLSWPDDDRHLAEQHWAWDPGTADLTRELAAELGAPAVLGEWSRLYLDLNRPTNSPTLCRDVADGRPIVLNRELSPKERDRRIRQVWLPYHAAVAEHAAHPDIRLILSVHSFTPNYEGQIREVQVGVLFDHDVELAEKWFASFRDSAPMFDIRRNEPWSGANGLMYSAQSHASDHGRFAIELEFRQDLITKPAVREQFRQMIRTAIRLTVPGLPESNPGTRP